MLAAVDPFHAHDKPASLDRQIVAAASDVASSTDGEVHLVHTYDLMMGLGRAANRTFKPIRLKVEEIESDMRREHREMLATLARQCDVDSERTHILSGSAREMIPAFARELGADLVVMGALARWGIKRAVIGSTAERVLDALHCDVLVVRVAPRD